MNKLQQFLFFFLFVLVMIFSNSKIKAQNTTPQNLIIGRVVDSISKAPIPFATVLLLSPTDSVIKTGVTTGKLGDFVFNNIEGPFLLKVRMMGYKDIFKKISTNANNTTDLGEILLNGYVV